MFSCTSTKKISALDRENEVSKITLLFLYRTGSDLALAMLPMCDTLASPSYLSLNRKLTCPGFGTNEAGAEFGQGSYPGVLGTHYIWPDLSTIATLHSAGMNAFRVAFSMERLVPDSLTGPVAEAYMDDLIEVCLLFSQRVDISGAIELIIGCTDGQWNHGSGCIRHYRSA